MSNPFTAFISLENCDILDAIHVCLIQIHRDPARTPVPLKHIHSN